MKYFREFTENMMVIKHQIDEEYHGYNYIWDLLLTAVDVTKIQAFKDTAYTDPSTRW